MSNFEKWKFSSRDLDDDRLAAPRVAPDPPKAVPAVAGVFALALLGFIEGTLVWFGLRWAAELGWLSETPGWMPIVGMVMAITYLRGVDRAVFRRT